MLAMLLVCCYVCGSWHNCGSCQLAHPWHRGHAYALTPNTHSLTQASPLTPSLYSLIPPTPPPTTT